MLVHANQKTEKGRTMQDIHFINILDQSLQLCRVRVKKNWAGRRSGEGGLMVLPCHLGHEILTILSRVDEATSKRDLQKTGTLFCEPTFNQKS